MQMHWRLSKMWETVKRLVYSQAGVNRVMWAVFGAGQGNEGVYREQGVDGECSRVQTSTSVTRAGCTTWSTSKQLVDGDSGASKVVGTRSGGVLVALRGPGPVLKVVVPGKPALSRMTWQPCWVVRGVVWGSGGQAGGM
jgi:hypothetical protein